MGMTIRERALYHQIHPLKLATDIVVTAPAIALFWAHQFWPGLLVTFVPSVIAPPRCCAGDGWRGCATPHMAATSHAT
ncbi:MAG: hypothetical protein ACRDID_15695 [Ktedonobacterales bacterium]